MPQIAAAGVLLITAASAGHHHHPAAHLGAAFGHEFGARLLDRRISRAAAEVGAGLVAESGHVAEIGHILLGEGRAEEAKSNGGEGSHHACLLAPVAGAVVCRRVMRCWDWLPRKEMGTRGGSAFYMYDPPQKYTVLSGNKHTGTTADGVSLTMTLI